MKAQDRYVPNPAFGGRKERHGFVTGKGTMGVLWCVAVKIDDGGVNIRDTKDVADTTLTFTKNEWKAFIQGVKDGEFDV